MIEANLKQVIRHQIICPHCSSNVGTVDHLLDEDRTFGPWYCQECGQGYRGKTKNRKVFIEQIDNKKVKTLEILKLTPTKDDIYIIANGMRWVKENEDKSEEEIHSNSRYFYEEHTCPSNILRNCRSIIFSTDEDLHGAFEYLGQSDNPDPNHNKVFSYGDLLELFPNVLKLRS